MKIKFYLFLAVSAILCFTNCKEDGPSNIPTTPTKLSIEDGAIVEELSIELKASGSTVEDRNLSVSYVYYIGKSADALSETSAKVNLEPYTQYYWCVQPKSYDIFSDDGTEVIGEKSDVRTFYCVPPIDVETDNGDGDWAAVLRFKGLDKNIKSGKVTATSDLYEYEMDIPAGQDSCYLSYKRDFTAGTNNAYTQWWDDSKGINYEPIIYDFKIELNVQVGDKVCKAYNTVKECILDKQECVRDHEFNVYRIVKIGNRQWLADDLRTKSFIYQGDTIKLDNVKYELDVEPYKTITLEESGSTGIVYCTGIARESAVYFSDKDGQKCKLTAESLLERLAPKGCRISNNDDWNDLEKYYGVESSRIISDGWITRPSYFWNEEKYSVIKTLSFFQGSSAEIRLKLSSEYDWIFYDQEEASLGSAFNAKPFAGEGRGCAYYTLSDENHQYKYFFVRILSTVDKGILIYGRNDGSNYQENYVSLRCVRE